MSCACFRPLLKVAGTGNQIYIMLTPTKSFKDTENSALKRNLDNIGKPILNVVSVT